jgi:hypothetical protein
MQLPASDEPRNDTTDPTRTVFAAESAEPSRRSELMEKEEDAVIWSKTDRGWEIKTWPATDTELVSLVYCRTDKLLSSATSPAIRHD